MEILYPYEPGKYGIPFTEFRVGGFRDAYLISGGSGADIMVNRQRNLLCFTAGPGPDYFRLQASSSGGWLQFHLINRNAKGEKHPDFFAGRFIDICLTQVFSGFKGVEGVWVGAKSDNFETYINNLMTGMSVVESANNTWTGRVLGAHGLKVRKTSDIDPRTDEGLPVIKARFTSETISLRQSLSLKLRGLWRQ